MGSPSECLCDQGSPEAQPQKAPCRDPLFGGQPHPTAPWPADRWRPMVFFFFFCCREWGHRAPPSSEPHTKTWVGVGWGGVAWGGVGWGGMMDKCCGWTKSARILSIPTGAKSILSTGSTWQSPSCVLVSQSLQNMSRAYPWHAPMVLDSVPGLQKNRQTVAKAPCTKGLTVRSVEKTNLIPKRGSRFKIEPE